MPLPPLLFSCDTLTKPGKCIVKCMWHVVLRCAILLTLFYGVTVETCFLIIEPPKCSRGEGEKDGAGHPRAISTNCRCRAGFYAMP